MEVPELPKGYFFEVIPGIFYADSSRDVPPKVVIKKRLYYFWSSMEFTVDLSGVTKRHPTREHVHRGMVAAAKGWEENQEKSAVYGQYPPRKIENLL